MDSGFASLSPVLLLKTFFILYVSQTSNSATEREVGCENILNYSNFIFNQGEQKKDHNSFI